MKPPSRENVCVIPCQFWTLDCYNSTCICLNIQFTKISQASYYQYKNPIYIQTPILKHIHTYIYIYIPYIILLDNIIKLGDPSCCSYMKRPQPVSQQKQTYPLSV